MSSPRTGSASGAPGGQLQDAMLKFSDEVFEAMQRLLRAQRELSQTMLGGGNGLLAERTEDVAGGGGDRSQPGGAEQQDESSDVTGAAGIDEDVALQEPGQDVMEPDGRCRPAVPLPLADLEGHALTLLQRPATAALDRGEVDETSLRPPSGVMKPKPFSPLNHFTVPSGMFPPGG
jgi:hypothetical protein